MTISYRLPTRPYSVIDAINRMAAATGSPRYAMLASHADYNGHAVSVYFNTYRGYWLAEYTWSGRNVLAQGDLGLCLRAAKQEYDRGALGASVTATYPDPQAQRLSDDRMPSETLADFDAACLAAGYSSEPDACTWRTPLHDLVNDAMSYERNGIAPAVGYLANSATVEEYNAKIDAHVAERRAAMLARTPTPAPVAPRYEPQPGTYAHTARMVVEMGFMDGDEADAWKDEMKDRAMEDQADLEREGG